MVACTEAAPSSSTRPLASAAANSHSRTLANYEKERKIPPASDRLIRMNFMVWMAPKDARADLIKRMAEVIKGEGKKPKAVTVAMPPTDIQTAIARQWQG